MIVKTPTLILEDVLTSKTPMIQRFLKNWKGSQLNESVQEEPMEVSYAEEVDTEFRDQTEEQKGQGCRLDERREEAEEVPESNGQNVQTMDTETDGEKARTIHNICVTVPYSERKDRTNRESGHGNCHSLQVKSPEDGVQSPNRIARENYIR